jgi:hypothetical protein
MRHTHQGKPCSGKDCAMGNPRVVVGVESHAFVGDGPECMGILGYAFGDARHGDLCEQPRSAPIHNVKVRPGQVTDGMVEAFRRAAGYDTSADRAARHREGLLAALRHRETEVRDTSVMTRKQRIAERTRDLLDEIVEESHVSPASVGEVADEIARYVLELDASGAARGLHLEVINRLNAEWAKRNRSRLDRCTHGADCQVHPDANQVHNFDDMPLSADVAARLAWMEQQRSGKSADTPPTLWDADPHCDHEVVAAPGGGIMCSQCPGWYCV